MTAAIVIPARFASTRLPGKPLLAETGKSLIQHVVERAQSVRGVSRVIVATDDTRIANAVTAFGGEARMTHADHDSGTDRIAEVAATLDAEIVVNLQGDEPQIDPAQIEQLIARLSADTRAVAATLATPFRDLASFRDPNRVKVVVSDPGYALYFSRAPIPYSRDCEPDLSARPSPYLLHLGIYAYRRPYLVRFPQLPPHPHERLEKLEQLRVLGTGDLMRVLVVPEGHRGVDTPDDYRAFVESVRGSTVTF